MLRVDDGFCYNGWEKRYYSNFEKPHPVACAPPYDYVWAMKICYDGNIRTCHSAIYFCWEEDDDGNLILQLYKNGYQQGPDCPLDCKWNCEE